MKNTAVFDSDLNPVLENSSSDDLATLVEYLGSKWSEGLTTSEAYKDHHPHHSKYADLIAKEIRDMGGNSFANLFRGFEGPSYKEIVCDVAKTLKVPYNKARSIEYIENAILETILQQALDKMTDAEKNELLKEFSGKVDLAAAKGVANAALIAIFRAGGFKSYQMAVVIANHIAKMLLGHGLKFAANAGLTKTLSILAGPVGWAITGIWTAVDLAGPSYKVTVPSVIHIAMLRKKLDSQASKSREDYAS